MIANSRQQAISATARAGLYQTAAGPSCMLRGRLGDLPPDPRRPRLSGRGLGAATFLADRPRPTAALAPVCLEVAVLVGQLTGDTFSEDLQMAHQLGQGLGGPHRRVLGIDGFD